ncbi:MAG TPA: TonB-dependent receptor plug domain-containing protein, partial [Lacibacter sp.]|nr:TonB-dependent receptor plug domain-containing protein [Lacibacter sp.]
MSKRIFYIVLLFLPIFTMAQKVITGTVKDDKTKQPLQGASVVVKGGTGGTTTNASGDFSLSVPAQAKTIIISYVGYESRDIAIGNNVTGLEILLMATEQLTDIVVVGSRNLSRTRTETPVAVDIIPITQIANQVGQTDLNQILTYVAPSFQSSRQTIADGTDHVDPAQLRGLGTDQILVLVNGKRRHQSALVNVNGTVNRGQVGTDLGAIPVTAIERVEVLRDGAAAQYGSDAIAGVINIVLKKNTGVLGGSVS